MNNHDEIQIAYKVGQALDRSTDKLDRRIRDRLQAARQNALEHQKATAVGLSLASVGHFTSEVLLPQARMLAILAALGLGVVGTYYWNNFQQAAENEVIDSALLADDLPINAYLDRGFSTWLEHSSQLPQQ
ncbi:MAG TPA: DUF3619 family protein [Rhodocyclaceae bacterium]|nr:DUF3619 family protein [Rhodocyclaceae bacterium]